MSTYYAIGCERCREDVSFGRESANGFCEGPNFERFLPFVAKHSDHVECLRVYNEYDPRYGAYSDSA